MSPRIRRWLAISSGVLVVVVALLGVAHTPLGRPMLRWLQRMPGCPVGADVDPATAARVRAQMLTPWVDPKAATIERVLDGLRPGQSSRAEADHWARAQGLRCDNGTATQKNCRGRLFGHERVDVVLRFADGRLLDAEVMTRVSSAERAVSIADTLDGRLAGGSTPFRAVGASSAEALRAGALAQRRREYRFANLRAEVRATNLGARGYVVRATAQALPE